MAEKMLVRKNPKIGKFTVDIMNHELIGPKGKIRLAPAEVAILEVLLDGNLKSRDQIMDAMGYNDTPGYEKSRAIDQHVCRLRRKLGNQHIHTYHREGYRLVYHP